MKTRISISLFTFLFVIAFNSIHAQSVGIIYEASFINYDTRNQYDEPYRDQIKNLVFSLNGPLSGSFQYSLKVGYGWNIYKTVYKRNSPYDYNDNDKTTTKGFPLEVEIRYQRFTGTDSLFEPIIGIGLGYYHYRTEFERNGVVSPDVNETNGFGQYITFGLNIHISKSIYSNIQFKKIMANNISTKSTTENESYKWDYVQQRGLNDLSVSLGVFLNLR